MAKAFKNAADAIKSSPWAILITLIILVGLFVSLTLMYEDYSTSLYGYESLGTRKANDWIVYGVALLPQLLQVIWGYTFIDDQKKIWAALGFSLAFLIDCSLDIYYKANGLGFETYIIAFFETTIIYTLGSEWLFLICGALLLDLLPHFLPQLSILIARIINGIVDFFKSIGLNIKNTKNETIDFQPAKRGRPPKDYGGMSDFDRD